MNNEIDELEGPFTLDPTLDLAPSFALKYPTIFSITKYLENDI